MFVILEVRVSIAEAIVDCFEREGIAAITVEPDEFESWFAALSEQEAAAVEAILLGKIQGRSTIPAFVSCRCRVPIIGVLDGRALGETLELFSAGVSDVVAKPFHVREILARVGAIHRRLHAVEEFVEIEGIRVYLDGRDPEVLGKPLPLPRRERRILEYLVLSRNLRVTKSQIFNRVYGVFNEDIHENVIESHISRLRKRLKQRLGFDPIDSQRYLGYRFTCREVRQGNTHSETWHTSLAQGPSHFISREAASREENIDGTVRGDDDQRVGNVCAG